jgi:hypothetical protein
MVMVDVFGDVDDNQVRSERVREVVAACVTSDIWS